MDVPKECISLFDQEHHPLFAQQLLRFREDDILCDITIVCGSSTFRAHRVVLCAKSEFFKTLCSANMLESSTGLVTLDWIKPHVFAALLKYFYTGNLDIAKEDIEELTQAASFMCLDQLLSALWDWLMKDTDTSTYVRYFLLSRLHAPQPVVDKFWTQLKRNFYKIVKSDQLGLLDFKLLEKLLSSEDLGIRFEEDALVGLLHWISLKDYQQMSNAEGLFSLIRFGLIHRDHFPEVNESTSLSELVNWEYRSRLHSTPRTGKLGCLILVCHDIELVFNSYKEDVTSALSDTSSPLLSHVICYNDVPLVDFAVTLTNRNVLIVGGEVESMLLTVCEVFRPQRNCLRENLPSLTFPRSKCGAVTFDDFIFVFGGCVGSKLSDDIEMFSPQIEEWITVGHLPKRLADFAYARYENCIYVFGGEYEHGGKSSSVVVIEVMELFFRKLRTVPLQDKNVYKDVARAEFSKNCQMYTLKNVTFFGCNRGVAVSNDIFYLVGRCSPELSYDHLCQFNASQQKFCEPRRFADANLVVHSLAGHASNLYAIGCHRRRVHDGGVRSRTPWRLLRLRLGPSSVGYENVFSIVSRNPVVLLYF